MSLCRCGVESFGLSGCYWCLKRRVDWASHPPTPDGLNETERAFVGIFPHRPSNGWRPADVVVRDPDEDADPERTAMLRILVGLGDMDELPSV